MPKALDYISAQQWAITSEYLEIIRGIAARQHDADIGAIETRLGRKLNNARSVSVRDDVAIIPFHGPAFRYANLFTEISGATSLEMLAKDFQAADDDPSIKTIILDADGPGGEANGVAEMAHIIRNAKTDTVAYIGGMAASAHYWIASAADRVVINKSAMAGSVGAVIGVDTSGDGEYKEIVSEQSPFKRIDVNSEDGTALLQKRVNALADVFISDVATYRGVTKDEVLADFGRGDMLIGQAAVDAGMADELGTLEDVITGLSGTTRGVIMDPKTNADPVAETPAIDRAYLDANHPDIVASIQAEAKAEERNRVDAIMSQGAKIPGHDKLVQAAIADEAMTAEGLAVQMVNAIAENGTQADHASSQAEKIAADVDALNKVRAEDPGEQVLTAEQQADKDWGSNEKLRAEFMNNKDLYMTHVKEEASK